jgi:hypothetical protein
MSGGPHAPSVRRRIRCDESVTPSGTPNASLHVRQLKLGATAISTGCSAELLPHRRRSGTDRRRCMECWHGRCAGAQVETLLLSAKKHGH